MKTFIAALALTFALGAGSALAQSATSGPTIDGGVELNVTADQDVSAAIGDGADSTQEIGSIDSGNITGDIEETVQAAEDVSASIGKDSCSDQKIGTIGASADCKK